MEVHKQNTRKSAVPHLTKKAINPLKEGEHYATPRIAHTVQKKPLKSLLIAGGIGYLLSALWNK